MTQWYYTLRGQNYGPFDETQIRTLIAAGTILPDTLVWNAGLPGWQKASVAGLLMRPSLQPAPTPPPAPSSTPPLAQPSLSATASVPVSQTIPTMRWLWCLAIIPFVTPFILIASGTEDWSVIRQCIRFNAYVITPLFAFLDFGVVKKSGHAIPIWWKIPGITLYPVYMILRIRKTDPAPRHLFASYATVWTVGLLQVILCIL